MPRTRSLAIYGLSILCALLFILQFKGWPWSFVLQMEIQTERYARLALLYDQGAGFRRQDSVVVIANGGPAFQVVRFPVSAANLYNLDLLQYDGSEPLCIRHAQLRIPGRTPLELTPNQIRPGHPGTTVTQSNGIAEIRGINGSANVAIALSAGLQEGRTARRLRESVVIVLGLSVVALSLFVMNRCKMGEPVAITHLRQNRIRNVFLIFLVATYVIASLTKLNGSATALWRIYADREAPTAGLIVGTPKDIRSDEWVGETPWIFSQAARDFLVENPGVGDGVMPLLNNLPARHWTMLFRPQMWAFFVTDVERAFAFYWNFKWFSLLLGGFLLFRAIARRNSVVALFGALFVFFSPFVQWWFSTPTCMPEMIGAFFLVLWALGVIGRAKSRWAILGATVVCVGSAAQFVFCAYPRFQIPLIHLAVFLTVGAFVAGPQKLIVEPRAGLRLMVLAITALLIVSIVLGWYHDVAGAIHRVSTLAYPGKVFSTGGGLPWQYLFMPFLEFAMTDQHYPVQQMNVCEAAGFLFFAPLIGVTLVRDIVRRRFDPIIVASCAFIALSIWFMLLGFYPSLAKGTGFSLVYSARVVLAISIASIIALCRYLSSNGESTNLSSPIRFTALISLAFILFAIFHSTNRQLAGFVDTRGVVAASIFFAVVFAALWYRRVVVAAILVLIPTIYSTALANPIGHGLPGFTQSEVFRWLSEAARKRPDAKWLVIGPPSGRTNFLPQFVKAIGIDTFGGYRCEPDQKMVRALDPTGKYAAVYNRYAEILFIPSEQPEPSFELTFVNHYNVVLPLKPEILHRLGVSFVLEIDMPAAQGLIEGYSIVGEREGLRLLEQQVP